MFSNFYSVQYIRKSTGQKVVQLTNEEVIEIVLKDLTTVMNRKGELEFSIVMR